MPMQTLTTMNYPPAPLLPAVTLGQIMHEFQEALPPQQGSLQFSMELLPNESMLFKKESGTENQQSGDVQKLLDLPVPHFVQPTPAYSMGPPDSPDFSQQASVPSLSPLQIVSPAMLQVSVPPSPGFSPSIAQSPIIPQMSAPPSLELSAAQLPVSICYIFPIPQPSPNPPTEMKFLSAKGNLTKFQVQSEFLTVETDVTSLQHQVQVLQSENGILKDYLLCQEQYHKAHFQELKHCIMNHQGISCEVEKEKAEDLEKRWKLQSSIAKWLSN
ncbi:hypothetical protein GYMLUDRAFT_55489 [Collybiopsis luxurians FD-317 M1]|nr:hypothetical protein GYMLUDRAFT_55489 [Collybiopsis luxurians FD-317 M1]